MGWGEAQRPQPVAPVVHPSSPGTGLIARLDGASTALHYLMVEYAWELPEYEASEIEATRVQLNQLLTVEIERAIG